MSLATLPSKDVRILVIDDEPSSVAGLLYILKNEGYTQVSGLSEPVKAFDILLQFKPDLVLLDWHMQEVSGMDVLKFIQDEFPEPHSPAVIVLTGDACPTTKRAALEAGASDFLTKPWDQSEVTIRIKNHLRMRALHLRAHSENFRLEELVQDRTAELQKTVAELRDVQNQVIAEERMRALATMAGGVAHDFNNALTVICGYSELYSRGDTSGSAKELRKGFEMIALASQDAKEIVRRLREFYRPFSNHADCRQPVKINALVEESIALAKPRWETTCQANGICIQVRTELSELPEISVMPSEIREVLLNLILNSVDAMPQGGTITLRTRHVGERVNIEVEDTGTGMPPETARRCLEPFYTTKGEGGTGLGLAITYGIINRHQGAIRIDSELNRGTKISISLPDRMETATPEDPDALPTRKFLSILVVDDDPRICEVVSRCLEADGHSVKVAANGCEALERFISGGIDLVITDRVMPKMSGDQLAAAIREIVPTEPIILLTGFEARSAPPEVSLLVSKPASMSSIRSAISRVMGV